MTKIFGHRGARGLAPENTVEAIEAGIAHHVDGVEFDVRVTSDGIAVLSHDPSLAGLVIRKHTYETLKQRKPDLATLDEALAAVGSRCTLLIEIKPRVPVEPIVQILREALAKNTQVDISILSRSQSTLRQVKAQLPKVQLVVNERWSVFIGLWRMRQLGTDRLQMNQRWLGRSILRALQRTGIRVSPYTVNSPKQFARWEPYVYGIVTDYPDRFEKH